MTKQKQSKKKGRGGKKKKVPPTPAPQNVTGNVLKLPVVRPLALKAPPKSHVKKTCSIFDPFCPEAYGARIPDGQARTFTAQGHGTFTMTTGATGGLASFVLCPMASPGYAQGTAATFPHTPAGLTEFQGLIAGTLFYDNADKYRIVSAGFIVRCLMPATTAQGWLTIQTQTEFVPGTSTIAGNFMAQDNQTVAVYPGMEVSYVFRPSNKVLSRQFHDKQGSTTDPSATGWPSAVCFYQGGNTLAALAVCYVEYFINVEFTFKNGSSLHPLLPPPEPVHPPALMALNKVQAESPSVFKGGVDYVEGKVAEAVEYALKNPGKVIDAVGTFAAEYGWMA